jgi:hypothetical protein
MPISISANRFRRMIGAEGSTGLQRRRRSRTLHIVFSAVREASPFAERRSADLSFITSCREIEIYPRSELLHCEMGHTLQSSV